MIGIYKITNNINNKVYIGQSNDIDRRIKEHCSPSRHLNSSSPIDFAIYRYGKKNFTFDVLEECSIEELNQKETYWIKHYQSHKMGYNCNLGGDQQSIGSQNGNAKLCEEDVVQIRIAYNQHKRQKEVYQNYKDKISWSNFQSVWQGKVWKNIMPEVFTEENKKYYCKEATNGEKSNKAILTDEEVLLIRNRYVTETAKQIYEDYKDIMSYQTLQQLLWGRHYKHLPIYSKKKKQWIK